jgi:hypothetical protein
MPTRLLDQQVQAAKFKRLSSLLEKRYPPLPGKLRPTAGSG